MSVTGLNTQKHMKNLSQKYYNQVCLTTNISNI